MPRHHHPRRHLPVYPLQISFDELVLRRPRREVVLRTKHQHVQRSVVKRVPVRPLLSWQLLPPNCGDGALAARRSADAAEPIVCVRRVRLVVAHRHQIRNTCCRGLQLLEEPVPDSELPVRVRQISVVEKQRDGKLGEVGVSTDDLFRLFRGRGQSRAFS